MCRPQRYWASVRPVCWHIGCGVDGVGKGGGWACCRLACCRRKRITHALLPNAHLRFVGDASLDDQKLLQQIQQAKAQGIIRACHHRNILVYHDRLARWESEQLLDFAACVPLSVELLVDFTHARHPCVRSRSN